MKIRLLGLFLLFLPLVASAQSFTPEAQSAYDDAMQPVNDAAARQIQQYEAQSRQAQQNMEQLLRDQQIQRLVDQHADYQRQQVEYQRQLLEQQRKQQQLTEESLQQKSTPYGQPSWSNNVAPQQPAQGAGRDSFAQGVADLKLPNFAGDMPKLQQPSSLDILREAGVVDQNGAPRNSSQDFADRIIQIQQEKRIQDAVVIEALAKQGCVAFKMEVNNPFPVCSAWNSATQNSPGMVSTIAAGASLAAFAAPASSVPGSNQSLPAHYPAAAAPYAKGNSSISPFVWLIIGSAFLAIILFGLFMPKPKGEIQAEADTPSPQ